MVSKKMKKISPPPPILSRSSRMRAIDREISGELSSIWGMLATLQEKNKLTMTLEELKDDISRYDGGRNCTFVMGVSCAEGGEYNPNIPFDQQSIYGKWRMAGGYCPRGDEYSDNCSSRCRGPKKNDCFYCPYECR